jgi:hypothetical protein
MTNCDGCECCECLDTRAEQAPWPRESYLDWINFRLGAIRAEVHARTIAREALRLCEEEGATVEVESDVTEMTGTHGPVGEVIGVNIRVTMPDGRVLVPGYDGDWLEVQASA